MNIAGAGLSGLIAAHIWPGAPIFDISEGPLEQHKALLRFRSDAVARVTGIEFKRVKVRKGIWADGNFTEPSICIANSYSMKCLNFIQPERSIWNIEPAERFIAPDNFYEQLIENCQRRIFWNHDYQFIDGQPQLSTIPLPIVLKKLGIECELQFQHKPITVERFKVSNCEAYQTIYYPHFNHSVYRASITGDTMIIEHTGKPFGDWEKDVMLSFGLHKSDLELLGHTEQRYGKIASIDDAARKRLLFDLTTKHGIFSLGRFAIWKNILLDDVVDDAAVIKRLMRSSHYDIRKELGK